MTDPEIEYARLVSGDAAAVRASATDYSRTDDVVGSHFRGLTRPR